MEEEKTFTPEGRPKQPSGNPHHAETITDLDQAGSSADAGSQKPLADDVQFEKHLTNSGLMTAEELEEFRKQAGLSAAQKGEATLADSLLQHSKLTEFQVEELRRGKTKGLVLGNYIVLEKLGEGGMGMVFKARHRRMKRDVALKVLPPGVTNSDDAINRFHREVEAAAKLQHANIASAFDADESDGIHFLVMECVDGPNLSTYIKEAGPLQIGAALNILQQAARGLHHAHAQGVVHRDIKPGNLLVNRDGVLKILDMGLAQLHSPEDDEQHTELTQSGRVMGTVDFMAPEQALDAKKVDHRADIYSLGCTLYFLLAGKPMSPPGALTQKLLWHQNAEPPSLKEANPQVSDLLNSVYLQMVAKKPAQRQASMAEVVEQLEACLGELSNSGYELTDIGVRLATDAPSTNVNIGFRSGPATVISDPQHTQLATLDSDSSELRKHQAAAPTAERARPSIWRWLLVGGGLLAVVLAAMFFSGVFGSNRPPPADTVAFLDLQVDQPGAEIYLDGAPLGVWDPDEPLAPVQLAPGQRRLRIVKEGFQPHEQIITTEAGKTYRQAVQLSPLVEPPPTVVDVQSRPYGQLLQWVFSNKGKAEIIEGDGSSPRAVSSIAETPTDGFDLVAINLSGSPIGGDELKRLSAAPNLHRLSLSDTSIGDAGLAHLAPLKELRSLDLANTPITNEGLKHVARLASLRDLNLQNTEVTDAGMSRLAGLGRLEKLYLSDTDVGDAGAAQLAGLSGLAHLALHGTYVTQEGYERLTANIPKENIAWDGVDVERQTARRLLEQGAVLQLSIDGSPAAEVQVGDKLSLPRERFHITVIDAGGATSVSDKDLESFALLPQLQEVRLDEGAVTATGLAHLRRATSLKKVDLGQMRPPEQSLAALRNALPDAEVTLQRRIDEEAAQLVLQQGGEVVVESDGGRLRISSLDTLPTGDYQLREAYLDSSGASDDDLAVLSKVTGLESLYVSGEGVTDAGVAQFEGRAALRDLSLAGTAVTSGAATSIAKLPGLRRLYLNDTKAAGDSLAMLARLKELSHLSLADTPLADESINALKPFGGLRWLSVSGTKISDKSLPVLAAMDGLLELQIERTEITDAGVAQLKRQLPSCKLVHDPLDEERLAAIWVLQQGGGVFLDTGEVINLEQLPDDDCTVVEIDLAELDQLPRDELASRLAACKNLKRLSLASSNAGDSELAALAKLNSLTWVTLDGLGVTDKGVANLKNLPALQFLSVRDTRVKGDFLADYACKDTLAYYYAGHTDADDSVAKRLAEFVALKRLDLTSTLVTDAGVEELVKLPELEMLSLANTEVGDAAVKTAAEIPKLKYLALGGTRVTDAAPLAAATTLEGLDLQGTKVDNQSLTALAKLKKLATLDVTRTKVTAQAVEAFKKSQPDVSVKSSAAPPQDLPNRNNSPPPQGPLGGGLFPF